METKIKIGAVRKDLFYRKPNPDVAHSYLRFLLEPFPFRFVDGNVLDLVYCSECYQRYLYSARKWTSWELYFYLQRWNEYDINRVRRS